MIFKNCLTLCFFAFFVFMDFSSTAVTGYCGSMRYDDEIFPAITITSNVQFGSNTDYLGNLTNLTMDIYQPSGDTAFIRPLIVWVHGGSFIGGTKNDADVTSLCTHFAKRGYVCASINYRLGMPGLPNQTVVTQAVYRAVQDMKAAIRYFRKDASNSNLYKTDPNMIFGAGSSAGAVTTLQLAYLDQPYELPSQIDTMVLGGMEGNSGNPGYPSTVNAIVNLCGALGDTSWMVAGDIPVCSMHGTNDNIVPYATSMLSIITIPIMVVSGSYSISERANATGIPNVMYTFYGASHVPYSGNTFYMDTTVRFVSNFLYSYMGCTPSDPSPYPNTFMSVQVPGMTPAIYNMVVYPNPSSDNIHVMIHDNQGKMFAISITDMTGRIVYRTNVEANNELIVERKNIAAGFYFIKAERNTVELIQKICIE